jgi:polyisoprenyl-phosphate glycosyltransferase
MDNTNIRSALVSIVVPCYNEEPIVKATHHRLTSTLDSVPDTEFEFIFVDDGSRDRTATLLRGLQAADPRMRVIMLSRNFGHQMATTAGIEHATGDAVVLIDADLQDPPELVAEMLTRWRAGADVVYGARSEREGETAFKVWTAKVFYRSINRISNVAIPLDTGDFRLMDRRVVDALLEMPEHDRFIRGMVAWLGFRQEPVHYKRAARIGGETKYPLRKMIRFALDGVLSFSLAPLRLAIWLGFLTAALAMLAIVYALLVRLFTSVWAPGWTFLLIAISSIGGIQLLCMGIVGEYVGRIFGEVKRRPLYVVRERLGFASPVATANKPPEPTDATKSSRFLRPSNYA